LYTAAITGTGAYLPARIMTNKELESVVDTTDEWIVSRTGIRERRIAAPNEATSDLAYHAAEQALENAGIGGADLDAIIVATVTPDMLFPSTACLLQARLKATKAVAFDLSAACTGFVYGLELARHAIYAGTWRQVLVVGGETLSRIVDWQDRNTCVLFGDGAGAAVVSRSEEAPHFPKAEMRARILGVHLGSDGSQGDVLTLPAGGSRIPATVDSVLARQHFVHMKGPEVYKFAVRIVGEAAGELLAKLGLDFGDIDYFVPHQANLRIIEGFAKRMKLPPEKILVNVEKYGNVSSGSIPIALHEFAPLFKPGQKIMLIGFGGGLTWGACLLQW